MSEEAVTPPPGAAQALPQAVAQPMLGLHPLSFLFVFAKGFKHVALPIVALVFFGRQTKSWELFVILPVLVGVSIAYIRSRAFRYQVGEDELVLREGVLDRTLRHIPLGRIQHISQRRQLPHRLLGVTELRLESASGGKPEAVMKVLGLKEAQALEALLHDRGAGAADLPPDPAANCPDSSFPAAGNAAPGPTARNSAPANTATHAAAPVAAGADAAHTSPQLLHQLSTADIIRLGLTSNRGMVIVGVAMGAIMPNDTARKIILPYMKLPFQWGKGLLTSEWVASHWFGTVLGVVAVVLMALVLLRALSVALAFFKYKGFTLTREGGKLVATFGLSTHVRASARLSRLQRWQIDENLVHRWMGRCRLGVAVAGGGGERGHGLEPTAHLDELAPIATPAQAQALLKMSLPALDWGALQWQPLPKAGLRKLMVQARWLLPGGAALLWLVSRQHWAMPWGFWPVLTAVLAGLWLWHGLAWGRFAAYAQAGDVLVHRCGVLRRRWVIVAMPRLQSLRLATSPLDRNLDVATLQADTQGGSRKQRALDMPGVPLAQAAALRADLWRRMV